MEKKLKEFAALIEADQAKTFAVRYPALDPPNVTIKPGKKYTKVDVGEAGKYMVDKTGNIWGIKAYGVIHRGKYYGTLDTIHDWFWGYTVGVKGR